jgi:hypothetical protein
MSFPRKKGICDQFFYKIHTIKGVDDTYRLRNSEEQLAAKTKCQLLCQKNNSTQKIFVETSHWFRTS